jgi:hypothetical protein
MAFHLPAWWLCQRQAATHVPCLSQQVTQQAAAVLPALRAASRDKPQLPAPAARPEGGNTRAGGHVPPHTASSRSSCCSTTVPWRSPTRRGWCRQTLTARTRTAPHSSEA